MKPLFYESKPKNLKKYTVKIDLKIYFQKPMVHLSPPDETQDDYDDMGKLKNCEI